MKKEIEILLKNNTKLIDLRSEKEFRKGSIPNSINIPILSYKEHKSVGIEYKKYGQKKAIRLGKKLVSGSIKTNRIQKWCQFIKNNPGTKIFCQRGGLRSEIALKWIKEHGVYTSKISGGYKRFRNLFLKTIQLENKIIKNWIIIGGFTGSGKTDLIIPFKSSIDLEGIANHRGSAFGKKLLEQPTTSNFENQLAKLYINNESDYLLLEDESRLIGKNILHDNWYKKMQTSALIILKSGMRERVDNILNEYILEPLINKMNNKELYNIMSEALKNIRKRLGGKRYFIIKSIMQDAFNNENEDLHRDWIQKILKYYYDPMYIYKMEKREKFMIFKGTKTEIKTYLKNLGVT